jgi:hypothetical protein
MVFSEGGSGVLMYATDGGEWTEIPPWERFTELVATAGEEGAA